MYLLLLLAPIIFLWYSTVDIYNRNPMMLENRVAAFTMGLLFILFLTDYAQQLIPYEYIFELNAYLKYPITFLSGGASLILHKVFTRKYKLMSYRSTIILASVPFLTYMIYLCWKGPTYFFHSVAVEGRWTMEQPKQTLFICLTLLIIISILNNYLAIRAWFKSSARFDKKRFTILLRSNIIYLSALLVFTSVTLILSGFISMPIPSTFPILPTLVWGITIRFMMVNSDFLPSSKRKYEVLYNISPVPIILLDRYAFIREANPSAEEMFGFDHGALENISFGNFLLDIDRMVFLDNYLTHFPNIRWYGKELTVQGSDGETKTILIDMDSMAENGEPYGLAIIRDITKRKEVEEHTAYLAHHDILTGLPNRMFFRTELEASLGQEHVIHEFAAILLIDLDRFKMINDTLGHQSGDEALKVVTARFRNCVYPEDMLARIGGDEFTVLIRKVSEYSNIIQLADRLLEAIQAPVTLQERDFFISASVGISVFPTDGQTADILIKNADIAMYHAKSNGGNQYQFYSKKLNATIKQEIEMENSLRRALDRNEFVLHYQPQIDISSGRIIGAEALLRWDSPEYGRVSPLDFISLAERTNLILSIGRWVIEEACREAKGWEVRGWTSLLVSVNVSVKQFMQPEFIGMIKTILQETGLQ
ncbi:MAG: diguanylate cyclase, partial [Gorillibacterium sp.]|nr:diguanylate cyclase [Gorillibacterium sp.]